MKEKLVLTPVELREEKLSDPGVRYRVLEQIITPLARNHILFATTESDYEVVIKIPSRKDGVEREWVGLKKAYDAGVPTPKPLILARLENGRLAIVTEKFEGENFYFHPNEGIKQRLGQIVRLMHKKVVINGHEWRQSGKSSFAYYDRHLFSWLSRSIEELKPGSKTFSLLEKFAEAMREHCKAVSPVFTHNDLHDGQVFIKEDGGLLLVDFEEWREESFLTEVAYYLFHSIRTDRAPEGFAEFMRGYLETPSLSENEKLVLIFNLLFISARALNYFYVHGHPYLEKAKINHQKILNYTEQEKIWKEL